MSEGKNGASADVRANALWGKGGSRAGELRTRRGTRGLVATLVALVALALPMAATAGNGKFVYVAPTASVTTSGTSVDSDVALNDAAWGSVSSDAAWGS